ncbi:hypothetical protein BNJ_00190 [Kaumoebavirus]|uniref:hypothetical protein n=1 Tax=Kaumoebavirus TaxID=1859492 RepID=UPI0009C293FC|nr:hypothetical protein BNJ_00190 [Kaumoebavirus]ARA72021.1 hypothetical protein BNJ_00190 [Kaumoebavirus]
MEDFAILRRDLEEDLSAAVDYLCSYAIKNYNTNTDDSMLLVTGGKAVAAYTEGYYKDTCLGWKTVLYSTKDEISQCAWELETYCNTLIDKYMPILPLTVFTAVQRSLHRFGHKYLGTEPPKITIGTTRENNKFILGMLFNGHPLINMLTITPKYCDSDEIDYLNELKYCNEFDLEHLLDDKRFYVSLDELVSYYENDSDGSDDFYLSAEKLKYHMENGTLLCRFDSPKCRDFTVYDCSGSVKWFKPNITLTPEHKSRDATMTLEKEEYQAVYEYTADSTINTPLLKSYYFDLPLNAVADVTQLERIEKLDEAFDAWDTSIINYPAESPLLMYRLTRYVDPPRNGITDIERDPNLFNIKAGDILPNICYTSTSYSNKMRASAFDQESQFKGCVFVISAKSSRGLIVVDKISAYPSEKEILLDRRGFLKVTKVDYRYTTEVCGEVKYNDRMVIYCDYLPRGVTGGDEGALIKHESVLQQLARINPNAKLYNTNPQRNIPLFVDNSEFDSEKNKSRRCLNPFMNFTRNGMFGGDKFSTFPADGTAAMAITIFHMHHNSFKPYGTRCNTINGPIYLPVQVLESNKLPSQPLAITGGSTRVIDLDSIFPEEPQKIEAPVSDLLDVAANLAKVIKFDRNELGLFNVILILVIIVLVLITAYFVWILIPWSENLISNPGAPDFRYNI